ncbi:MAG: aminotransferase class III-fold pyridoxal phosphate-dependent enzyme [Spirochaetales bacterium]|nr:aminotransferase class III-fold pyridoxal phosphate-dependent enzyme [Spirochaetales bacterium]
MSGYGITHYHDTKEIYRQLDRLLHQPVRSIKAEALKEYEEEYFNKKCLKSKAMIERAKKFIPGGVQHNLAFNHPFPLVFDRAEGAILEDIDGNRYLDFLNAGGPAVLGSNPPGVLKKVEELLEHCGPSTGLFHEYELKIAELICSHIPSVEMFRMLNSGTEACMASIRVARLATHKKNIVKMGGAYHGWSDQLAYGIRLPGSRHFEAKGVPVHIFKQTQEFFPNDLKSLERTLRANTFRGGTAAVIIEPLGPESGTRPLDFDFNAGVRDLCDKYGALLIFDEVVTAFRVGMAGAQGYFGVMPDLTVFGKIVAGGYPSAGGLGGKREYMNYLAAGIKAGGGKKALVGGTLAANPLSAAAGYFTLEAIDRTNACQKAGLAGDRLTRGLQELIKKYNLPFVAYNQGSICHLETVGTMLLHIDIKKFWKIKSTIKEAHTRKKAMEEMGAAYMAEGIVTLAGSRLYTSAAFTDELIDEALTCFERVFKKVDGVTS